MDERPNPDPHASPASPFFRLVLVACVAGVGVLMVFPLCSHLARPDLSWSARFLAIWGLAACGLAGVGVVLWRVLKRAEPGLAAVSEQQAGFLDSLPDRWIDAAIVLSAGVSLFLELAMIRWQTSLLPILALCTNFALLACFAGLGLGYALADSRRIPLVAALPLLGVQILVLTALRYGLPEWHTGRLLLTASFVSSALCAQAGMWALVPTYYLLAVSFLLTSLAFVPVGQACGRLMGRRPKLRGYGLNLLGSLFGVVLFFAASSFWTPPPIWFLIVCLGVLPFLAFRRDVLLAGAVSALVTVAVLVWPVDPMSPRLYTPYQVFERLTTRDRLLEIRTVDGGEQRVMRLPSERAASEIDPQLRDAISYYELPYRVRGQSGRVAVIGAGLGNDVAAALRAGSEHVDAIEIDPAVLRLGVNFHPERPYSDLRVRQVVDDARSFLRTSGDLYDVITYANFGSPALLTSGSSNVRISSYVYTVEGLREARARLRHGGVLSVALPAASPERGRKFFLMLQEAFGGHPPVVLESALSHWLLFLEQEGKPVAIPPQVLARGEFVDVTAQYADPSVVVDCPTDDWPFAYMLRRTYPFSYLPVAALLLALTLLLARLLLHGGRPSPGHLQFFLLGSGFMLVETKAITELSLAFGSTWHVVGIAIMGILVMAFLANAAVALFQCTRVWVPYLLLLGSLALGYALVSGGGFSPTPWGRLTAAVVLTCPMFFSGIIFSTLLRSGGGIAGIMAANLLGAMLGGFLEYNSMYFGFASLYLIAMVLYALAFASGFWRGSAAAAKGVTASS